MLRTCYFRGKCEGLKYLDRDKRYKGETQVSYVRQGGLRLGKVVDCVVHQCVVRGVVWHSMICFEYMAQCAMC
jgi:hypothetical protein